MSVKPQAPPATWSLTARLTRYLIASAVLILGAALWVLHWALERSLDARDEAQVLSKVQVLQTLLREHYDKPEVLISEIEHEAAENQALKYYLRILDGRGHTLLETSGMGAILPASAFPPPAPVAVTRLAGGRGILTQHEGYLLASVVAVAGGGESKKRSLQVGLDLAPTLALIETYHRVLLGVFLAGVGLMSLAAWLIARHGIRPLSELAERTANITASRLNERVSAQSWPSELAQLGESFDAMLARLEGSFQRLSEFSSDIAHALRNPINNLRGESEVALARARSAEEYQQVLASNLEELGRLSRMIDNLLFIARADNPSAVVQKVEVSARRELEAVKEFYESLAAEAGVEVTCEGAAQIQGDPMLVRRAVSNLLGNALKHTPRGGRVCLSARPRPDGGGEIIVQDTGVGIPAESLPRIFDRFYQVDKSRDLTEKGSGLGLAIVQSIARLHHGEVLVQSTVGAGTTFMLGFPPGAEVRKM